MADIAFRRGGYGVATMHGATMSVLAVSGATMNMLTELFYLPVGCELVGRGHLIVANLFMDYGGRLV